MAMAMACAARTEAATVSSVSRDSSTTHTMVPDGNAMGELFRSFEWTQHPLGDPTEWAPEVLALASLVLNTRMPMALLIGTSLYGIYNDAYGQLLSVKHPSYFGQPVKKIWPMVQDDDECSFTPVLYGESIFNVDKLCPLQRGIRVSGGDIAEESYFTWSCSPVFLANGSRAGVLLQIMETSSRIFTEQRLHALHDLSFRVTGQRTVQGTCAAIEESLSVHSADITMGLVYLRGESGKLVLQCAINIAHDHPAAPPELVSTSPWPLEQILVQGTNVFLTDLAKRFDQSLPRGVWPEPTASAYVAPILVRPGRGPAGVVILGTNPRRPMDNLLREHLELMVQQIDGALTSALASEEEKRRAEMLVELDHAKSKFFSSVSHELRTPLTLIRGPLQEMRNDFANPLLPIQRRRLELVDRNSGRLLKLVNSLLDVSRIEGGRAVATFVPVKFARLTSDLANVFRPNIEGAGLAFIIDISDDVTEETAYLDIDQWEKVIFNLLSNAFKFTVHGSITLRLERGTIRKSSSSTNLGNLLGAVDNVAETPAISMRVIDTGCGIPHTRLPRLFERFYQVKDAPKGRSMEGSGIGLALTQEVVHMHGGHISVTSAEGVGTEFAVTIPLGKNHLPADQVQESSTASQISSSSSAADLLDPINAEHTTDSLCSSCSPQTVLSPPYHPQTTISPTMGSTCRSCTITHDRRDSISPRRDSSLCSMLHGTMGITTASRPNTPVSHNPIESEVEPAAKGHHKEFTQWTDVDDDESDEICGMQYQFTSPPKSPVYVAWPLPPTPATGASQPTSPTNVKECPGSPPGLCSCGKKSKPHVLLVDDNHDMRMFLKSLLSDYDVDIASDGQEALERIHDAIYPAPASLPSARPRMPDIIVSDTMMPRMDGLQLLHALRKDERTRRIPVILLSARTKEEARVEGLQAGADDYMCKPFSPKELRARVLTQLHCSQLRSHLENAVILRTQALLESEDRYRKLAMLSPVGIFCTDTMGQLTYVNERWMAIMGLNQITDDTIISWLAAVADEDRQTVDYAWQRTLKGIEPLAIEFRIRRAIDGQIVWVLGQSVWDTDTGMEKHLRGLVVAFSDITQRKALESERLAAVSRAEEEASRRAVEADDNRRKQELFVDMVCHEIRNPLNGIVNNVDLLVTNVNKRRDLLRFLQSPQTKDSAGTSAESVLCELIDQVPDDLAMLQSIDVCMNHQVKITDDVLNLSKLRSGNATLDVEPVNPVSLVRSVVNIFATQARSNNIDLQYIPPDPSLKTLKVKTDAYRLSQVVINLVSNAIKFTVQSLERRVTVRLACHPDREDLGDDTGVSSESSSQNMIVRKSDSNIESLVGSQRVRIEISVQDTGIGMTKTELTSLFQRFQQATPKTYSRYGGSGLGLYITKMVLDLMNGSINVESEPLKGSTFTVSVVCDFLGTDDDQAACAKVPTKALSILSKGMLRLPAAEPVDAVPDESMIVSPVERSRNRRLSAHMEEIHVLIVEDNDINQQVLQRQLSKNGEFKCHMFIAYNGQDAVQQFLKAEHLDVVLMDVEMPIMDGLEATRRIRDIERAQHLSPVTIIGLSGNARDVHAQAGYEAGMDEYIQKPYAKDKLIRAILGAVKSEPSIGPETTEPAIKPIAGPTMA